MELGALMSTDKQHWSENPYWTDALDAYTNLRIRGQRTISLDLDKLEEFIFNGESPAYQLIQGMRSVEEHEACDGYRGAPRLVLALLAHLESHCNSCDVQ